MTGTVTKTIGTTGRDYSTLQAWEDALPANLVTNDNNQIGECYNDSEFVSATNLLTISGETVDATHTITLRAASGQGFKDHASVQTNALRYDQGKGVGIRITGSYATGVTISVQRVTLSGLQISASGGGNNLAPVSNGAQANTVIDSCIVEASRVPALWSNATARNTLFVMRRSSVGYAADLSGSACYGLTIATPSDFTAGTAVFRADYGTHTFENCAFFGAGTLRNGTHGTATYTTCKCDSSIGSPPSGVTAATYNTALFTNITDATRDYKPPSGSALVDAGTTDATNMPLDIVGTSRPSGSSYDVGCWELVAGAGAQTLTPSGIASLEAFGTHQLNLAIAATGIASAEALGSHQLNLNISATGIATAEAFGADQLNFILLPTGIAGAEAFGTAIVIAGNAILASAIASAEAFGSDQLDFTLLQTGIASAEAFGSTVLLAGNFLLPAAIGSAEAFGSHTLLPGGVSISPSGIASLEAFGSHTLALASVQTLIITGIATGELFGSDIVSFGVGTVIAATEWIVRQRSTEWRGH